MQTTKRNTKAGTTTKAATTRKPRTPKTTTEPTLVDHLNQAVDTAILEANPDATVPVKVERVKAAKPMPTLEEALATAKHENPNRFAHVLAVTELAKDGSPKRVLIECTDPQTKQGANGEQVSVCEGTREIATQDLFQVSCCAACADRKVRKARRNRAKTRAKEARKLLAARKA